METDFESHVVDAPPAAEPQEHRTISGFWRRSLAFVLDGILIGLVGLALGLVLFDFLAQLGGWGRLVGFGVALAYFGLLNSSAGDGQTLGKRIMKIAVVDRNGNCISPGRSFVRYTVLAAPFFLNGAMLSPSIVISPIGFLIGLVVFGLGGATLYLYIFNRATRQSVHDLVVGTFVVKTCSQGKVCPRPVWKPNLVIAGVWVFLVVAALCVHPQFVGGETLRQLLTAQESIQATGKVHTASVSVKTVWALAGGRKGTYVESVAVWKERPHAYGAAARQVAAIILKEYPGVMDKDGLVITIAYGYDIGIAHYWQRRWFAHRPQQWRQILAKAPAAN